MGKVLYRSRTWSFIGEPTQGNGPSCVLSVERASPWNQHWSSIKGSTEGKNHLPAGSAEDSLLRSPLWWPTKNFTHHWSCYTVFPEIHSRWLGGVKLLLNQQVQAMLNDTFHSKQDSAVGLLIFKTKPHEAVRTFDMQVFWSCSITWRPRPRSHLKDNPPVGTCCSQLWRAQIQLGTHKDLKHTLEPPTKIWSTSWTHPQRSQEHLATTHNDLKHISRTSWNHPQWSQAHLGTTNNGLECQPRRSGSPG